MPSTWLGSHHIGLGGSILESSKLGGSILESTPLAVQESAEVPAG